MEKLPVEINGFYYALRYLEGIIEADKFNEMLQMTDSVRLEYLLNSLNTLDYFMIEIKKSAVSKTADKRRPRWIRDVHDGKHSIS